jgi:hypothetical protein
VVVEVVENHQHLYLQDLADLVVVQVVLFLDQQQEVQEILHHYLHHKEIQVDLTQHHQHLLDMDQVLVEVVLVVLEVMEHQEVHLQMEVLEV